MTGRWLAATVVGGALLAVAIALALDHAFVLYMENQARTRLAARAHGALGLAEGRIDQASNALIVLASAGVDSCGPKALETMRIAVFESTPLKELSVLDEQGRALCTHVGTLVDTYAVSREYSLPGERIALATARFRDFNDRALRVRLERPSGRSIAALVAIDALLPEVDFEQGAGGKRMRLMFASGETIAARPTGDEGMSLDGSSSLSVRKSSDRFPIEVIAEQSRTALAGEYRDLQFFVRFSAMIALTLGAGLIWMALRRGHDDPAAELRRALHAGEIIPYYQPTVDTRSGRIRGAEVLARWRRRDGSIVSPAHFIPLAEQSGLIFDLTLILMRRAREEMGAAYRQRPQLRLAFNLFAGHLADAKIVDDVKNLFDGSSISTNQIVLEVTERAPLPDLDEARRVIELLQTIGVKVAIDDVGTGHGGLSYLLKLGVDMIKIDKMFIDAIGTERYSLTIIETLVELGRTMKMEVIAEGVETFAQLEYLRLKGVLSAQGYVFAPPVPAAAYLALIEAMEPASAGGLPTLTAASAA
ncbi:MAG: EAL domain-containing protein [Bradyrhizobiaceae bacterium]|nr:EAL domain-containing protein [Bradyrhizobiaceae bacterium]